jgi:DNA-directed RNA polymerase specialized sigma subunit
MRLSNEEYKEASLCLKRYNYNCLKIMNIRADIMSIGSPVLDGMPKAPYSVSDRTLKAVIELQENEYLQKAIKEYKAVVQAVELVNKDSKYIFENLYIQSKTKWEVIDGLGVSEETYKRRKRDLVYAVYKELKKVDPKLTQN